MQIVEDVPEVDAVVVPVGGAGLIAGVACAVKTLKPECKVRYLSLGHYQHSIGIVSAHQFYIFTGNWC